MKKIGANNNTNCSKGGICPKGGVKIHETYSNSNSNANLKPDLHLDPELFYNKLKGLIKLFIILILLEIS